MKYIIHVVNLFGKRYTAVTHNKMLMRQFILQMKNNVSDVVVAHSYDVEQLDELIIRIGVESELHVHKSETDPDCSKIATTTMFADYINLIRNEVLRRRSNNIDWLVRSLIRPTTSFGISVCELYERVMLIVNHYFIDDITPGNGVHCVDYVKLSTIERWLFIKERVDTR